MIPLVVEWRRLAVEGGPANAVAHGDERPGRGRGDAPGARGAGRRAGAARSSCSPTDGPLERGPDRRDARRGPGRRHGRGLGLPVLQHPRGGALDCRTVEVAGQVLEELPEAMIAAAIMTAADRRSRASCCAATKAPTPSCCSAAEPAASSCCSGDGATSTTPAATLPVGGTGLETVTLQIQGMDCTCNADLLARKLTALAGVKGQESRPSPGRRGSRTIPRS